MKKMIKKILAVTLSSSMMLSLAACGGSDESKENTKQSYFGQVWSAPSSVKIAQDNTKYADKGEATLAYKAVRNEYESCQLLITADKEVSSFELKAADLNNGKHTLSKENITVYMQKYVTFSDVYGDNLSMPDALIPMENAAEYQENVIKKGNNGALWVTVYVPKELEAGVYEGTFQLVLKGEKKEETMDIPVSVDVYDYTMTDSANAATLFSWRYDRVAAGELNGSNQMMTTYYEFFKDYRISLQSMPLEGLTGAEFAENVLKYYDEISSYSILKVIGDISISVGDFEDLMIEQILAVAEVCPEDKNLLDKAIVYPRDEPNVADAKVRADVITALQRIYHNYEKAIQLIKEDNTGKYDTFKSHENWEESIRDIKIIIPTALEYVTWMLENQDTEEGKELLEAYDVLCPYFSDLTEGRREAIIEMCERFDIDLWWYGCTGPQAPSPTYHIGDVNLLSARTVSWLQYAYGVEGNLYWDAAASTDEASEFYNQYINVYETPFRGSHTTWPAGDGFLAYPGAAYGVYGPLPSLRLMSIRDGMEEYELLKAVEEGLEEKAATFGTEFSAKEAMNGFYEPIANDVTRMQTNGQKGFNFEAVRTNLLNALVSVNRGNALLVSNMEYEDGVLTITYFVQEGATVAVDGKVQQAVSGQKYEYSVKYQEVPKVEFVVTSAEGQEVRYVCHAQSPIELLNGFADSSVTELVSVSEGSDVRFVVDSEHTIGATDEKALQCNIKGVVTGDVLVDAGFKPYLTLNLKEMTDVKLTDLEELYINMINPGSASKISLILCSGNSKQNLGSYDLLNGTFALSIDLSKIDEKKLESVDSIMIEFSNLSNEEAASYEFYIDGISGQRPYEGGK